MDLENQVSCDKNQQMAHQKTRSTFSHPSRVIQYGDFSCVSEQKLSNPLEELSFKAEAYFQDLFEGIIFWTQQHFHADEFVEAKNEFQQATGKVFYDDPFYHKRTDYFLDYFIFEKVLSQTGKTPYQSFLESEFFEKSISNESTKEQILQMADYKHSLFLVVKIKKTALVLKNLFDQAKLIITADASFLKGFEQDSIFQGFIFKNKACYILSHGLVFHPKSVSSFIKKQVKQVLKQIAKDPQKNLKTDLMKALARMNINTYRHKHVDERKIYQIGK